MYSCLWDVETRMSLHIISQYSRLMLIFCVGYSASALSLIIRPIFSAFIISISQIYSSLSILEVSSISSTSADISSHSSVAILQYFCIFLFQHGTLQYQAFRVSQPISPKHLLFLYNCLPLMEFYLMHLRVCS